jgi:acid phosphatase type 7
MLSPRLAVLLMALVVALGIIEILGAESSASGKDNGGHSATDETHKSLVAVGDISSCANDNDEATAKLLGGIRGTTILTLGDEAYEHGTRAQFRHCYRPTWGEYKKHTKPTTGNHEYQTSGAKPYFDYFGRRAGKPGKGYYAYDRGSWHLVALNSNCARAGGCGAHSPQGRWLRRNLRKHRARCTLTYFHHPLFSSGEHGNQTKTRPIWRALYRANADVVLSGHDHDYERFAPQRPDGTRNPRRGIREFVVGTGGAERRPFGTIQPHSQARNARTSGVLKLKLRSRSYRWRFVPVAGRTFTDSGKDRCH